jgi:hypothetical protein
MMDCHQYVFRNLLITVYPLNFAGQDRHDNHRGGDLRDRLDRRCSPHRRRSPSRDGQGGRPGDLSDRRFSPGDGGRRTLIVGLPCLAFCQ